MPKFMAVHVVVLAGLVVAVTFLNFQARALTIKVQALEAAAARSVPTASKSEDPAQSRQSYTPAPDEFSTLPPGGTRSRIDETSEMPGTEAPTAPAAGATLTPAQEKAVAETVDRILKEKYGHLPKFGNPEDLEKTLAKELNLTESQKARIADILKRKREDFQALFEGGDPMAGSNMKKAMDIERRSEAAIKNELDSAQQAKYDQLKKDGKIPLGVRIQVEAEDGSQKEEFEVR